MSDLMRKWKAEVSTNSDYKTLGRIEEWRTNDAAGERLRYLLYLSYLSTNGALIRETIGKETHHFTLEEAKREFKKYAKQVRVKWEQTKGSAINEMGINKPKPS